MSSNLSENQKVKNCPYADLSKDNLMATFMELTRADEEYIDNFDKVVDFLSKHTSDLVNYVHSMEHLFLDDGKTMVNCPPEKEPGDDHGGLLIKTYSESSDNKGVKFSREIEVHETGKDSEGNKQIEVHCRYSGNYPKNAKDSKKFVSCK